MQMKKGNFIITILCMSLIFSNCIGQGKGQTKIDSLLALLKTDKLDTTKIVHLNKLAWEFSTRNTDTAIIISNEALRLSEKLKWQTGIGTSYNCIGWVYYNRSDYKFALKSYDNALKVWNRQLDLLTEKNDIVNILKRKSSTLGNIGIIYDMQGDYPKSLDYYFKAMKIDEKLNYRDGVGRHWGNIGLVFSNQGDNRKAIDAYLRAFKVAKETGNRLLQANSLSSIGEVYSDMADYKTALEYYFKALEIDEEIENNKGMGVRYGNVGGIFMHQNDWDKALQFYNKALEADLKLGSKSGISRHYGNIGSIYYNLGRYDLALEYEEKALKIKEEIGQKNGIAFWTGSIGNIYLMQKKYSSALEHYNKALKLFNEIGDTNGIAKNLGNIGLVFTATKRYLEAEKILLKAQTLLEDLNSVEFVIENQKNLSELYAHIGDYKKSLEYYTKATLLRDSIFNEDKVREVTNLLNNYEFEKQKALTKAEQDRKDVIKNAEIEKQKQARNYTITGASVLILVGLAFFFVNKKKRETVFYLKVSETEMKALRAQMNPHFIVNALDSIKRFSGVNKAEEVDNYIEKFKNLMRFIVNNSQKEEISLEDDLDALMYYMDLEKARNPFTYEINIDETVDLEFDKIPPLILQPFVENAIKHGFQSKPTPGHINIYIRKENEILICIVEDNGVGRDLSEKVKNPMLIQNQSMGIRITKERLLIYSEKNKVKANFKIIDMFDNSTPTGTKVELSLPLVA